MKANLEKCHFLLSTTEVTSDFQLSKTLIHNSHSRKLLEVTIDKKLKFEKHIATPCQKSTENLMLWQV